MGWPHWYSKTLSHDWHFRFIILIFWYSDNTFLDHGVIRSQCDIMVPREVTQVTNDAIVTHFSIRLTCKGNFLVAMTTYPLPWFVLPWQQFSLNPKPFMLEFHTLFSVLWALRGFFGCHSNRCQGNQSLDIFQLLWFKGPPFRRDQVVNTWDIRRPKFALYYINLSIGNM